MPTIGLIGAGRIGSQLARLAVAHGDDVVLSDARAGIPFGGRTDWIDNRIIRPLRRLLWLF